MKSLLSLHIKIIIESKLDAILLVQRSDKGLNVLNCIHACMYTIHKRHVTFCGHTSAVHSFNNKSIFWMMHTFKT